MNTNIQPQQEFNKSPATFSLIALGLSYASVAFDIAFFSAAALTSADYAKYEAPFLLDSKNITKFKKAPLVKRVYFYAKAFFKYAFLLAGLVCVGILGTSLYVQSNIKQLYRIFQAKVLKKDVSYKLISQHQLYIKSARKARTMLLSTPKKIKHQKEKTKIYADHLEKESVSKKDIHMVFIPDYTSAEDSIYMFDVIGNYRALKSLHQISKTHHVVVRIIKNINDMNAHIENLQKDFPKKTVKNIEICAHGSSQHISLGNEDIDEKTVNKLSLSKIKNPVNLILNSCQTGNGKGCIAQKIANAHANTTVYASESLTFSGLDIRFENQTNDISKIYFNTLRNSFIPIFKTAGKVFKKEKAVSALSSKDVKKVA